MRNSDVATDRDVFNQPVRYYDPLFIGAEAVPKKIECNVSAAEVKRQIRATRRSQCPIPSC